LTKSGDAGEDLIGRLDPPKRLGGLIAGRHVETDRVLQLAGAPVGAPPQLSLSEQRKPALHLIDPGAVGGREMDLEAGMAEQPALDERRLVGAVVTHDQVDLQLAGQLAINGVKEAPELDRSMAAMRLPDDLAARHIEGGEERGGAVPAIVMGAALGHAGSQGQDGLGAVQLVADAELAFAT
jgi:hypothetical protein